MSFGSPLWLLALMLVPVLLALQRLARGRRRRYAIRFPAAATAAQAARDATGTWRRQVPVALLLAASAALALALARPRVSERVAVQQASVMLVCDHSGSMAASDVQPTRLSAAQRAADTFIGSLPGSVRVGAIAFGSSADAVQGPVVEHGPARTIIDSQVAGGATATGDALSLALSLLHGAQRGHPPAVIVLLSDGSANTGLPVPAVARQAAQDRIPIYTVALGTPNGVLQGPDPAQPPIPVPPDPELMREIAQLSGGRSFDAQSADELSSIYSHLASELGTVARKRDVTVPVALVGGLLILLAGGAAVRLGGRLP